MLQTRPITRQDDGASTMKEETTRRCTESLGLTYRGGDVMKTIVSTAFVLLMALVATVAWADTATIDFDSSTGPLAYHGAGAGTLTSSAGRASFTGQNMTLLGTESAPISCTGANSVTIEIRPATDAGAGVGLILADPSDPNNIRVTAVVSSDGTVTMTDWIGNSGTATTLPSALNTVTLEDDRSLTGDNTTLVVNQGTAYEQSAILYGTMSGALQAWIGVLSNGTGGFETFTASGPDIPQYPTGGEAEGEVMWIEGTTPPAAWTVSPSILTADSPVHFSGPTAVYDNECVGRQMADGTPILVVDAVNHRVELQIDPPPPVMCPLFLQPVCGLQGQFGPLEEGDWLFVADTPIASFSIPFHIFAAGYEGPAITQGAPVAGMTGLGLVAAACALAGALVLRKKEMR